MKTLRTSRLILRSLKAEDFEEYAAMLADPEVGRFFTDGKGMSRAESWRHLALVMGHEKMRGFSMFAVLERETNHFVGRVGPWQPLDWPGLEVGWCLARRYWGLGYATEAARAALRYCFDELGATEVISLIRPANTRSAHVAERIGHRLQGETDLHGVRCNIYGQTRPD
jgi:RimJ/RimL family protein N-acetyltransferase